MGLLVLALLSAALMGLEPVGLVNISAGASGGDLSPLNKIWPLQPEGWPVIINVLQ